MTILSPTSGTSRRLQNRAYFHFDTYTVTVCNGYLVPGHQRPCACSCLLGTYSLEKWLYNRIYCPNNLSKQIKETHTAYGAGTQYTRQSLNENQNTWLHRRTVIGCEAMYVVFHSNFAAFNVCQCYNAGFRLTCRLPHCCFDDDISSTAQASLAAEGWASGKQRQANRSITLPLCPPRQIANSWILFNSGAIAARWRAIAALPLRAATLKQQAMASGVAAKRRAAS